MLHTYIPLIIILLCASYRSMQYLSVLYGNEKKMISEQCCDDKSERDQKNPIVVSKVQTKVSETEPSFFKYIYDKWSK
jgi:hypothetical protein